LQAQPPPRANWVSRTAPCVISPKVWVTRPTVIAVFNYIHYNSPVVQNLLNRAHSTFNPAARARLIVAAQKLYTRAGLEIPLLSLDEAVYMKKGVTGASSSFAYIYEPSLATIGAAS